MQGDEGCRGSTEEPGRAQSALQGLAPRVMETQLLPDDTGITYSVRFKGYATDDFM